MATRPPAAPVPPHATHLLRARVVSVVVAGRQRVRAHEDAPLDLGAEAGAARGVVHVLEAAAGRLLAQAVALQGVVCFGVCVAMMVVMWGVWCQCVLEAAVFNNSPSFDTAGAK